MAKGIPRCEPGSDRHQQPEDEHAVARPAAQGTGGRDGGDDLANEQPKCQQQEHQPQAKKARNRSTLRSFLTAVGG